MGYMDRISGERGKIHDWRVYSINTNYPIDFHLNADEVTIFYKCKDCGQKIKRTINPPYPREHAGCEAED